MHDEVSGPRAQGAERVFNPAGQLELERARFVLQTAFTVIQQDLTARSLVRGWTSMVAMMTSLFIATSVRSSDDGTVVGGRQGPRDLLIARGSAAVSDLFAHRAGIEVLNADCGS